MYIRNNNAVSIISVPFYIADIHIRYVSANYSVITRGWHTSKWVITQGLRRCTYSINIVRKGNLSS